VPLRKVVSRTPPTVVVRKKAVKPAPRSGQAQPVPTPAPAPAAAQSQGHPVAPPLMPAPAELQLKPFLPPQSAPQPQAPAGEAPSASPATATASPSQRQQEEQARRELLEVFRQRWPQVFPQDLRHLKPLALGIHRDPITPLPEQPLRHLSAVIGLFQRLSGAGYLKAIMRGGPRYDLEGNPRGGVTPQEQELAQHNLAALYEGVKRGNKPVRVR
jgi:ProP effector